jgi:hypothetical protein
MYPLLSMVRSAKAALSFADHCALMRFSASSAPALHKEIASHIETGGRRNVLSHVLVSVHQPFLLRFFVNPDGKSLGAHLIGFLLKEQWCIEDYVQRADAEVPQEYA